MLPNLKTTAIAAVTALSVALTAAAPAHALGRNERNFLKGVAATLIIGAILNDTQTRARPAPQPLPAPQPHYRDDRHNRYDGYERRSDDYRPTGRVVGSTTSVYSTVAAQTFNTYRLSERREIQMRLRSFGYYGGAIDGTFGPGTYRAIVAYARDTNGESALSSRAGSYGIYDSLIA